MRKAFPGARILRCVIHVVKYLQTEMAKREYELLDRDKVEDAIHLVLNAQTEAQYETGRKHLYYIVEGKKFLQREEVPEAEGKTTTTGRIAEGGRESGARDSSSGDYSLECS